MDKYLQKTRAAEEAIAGEIADDRMAEFSQQEMMEAAVLLGRAQAADRISVAISAQVIRFLEHFEKTKAYRALGHKDFVTFLKHSGLHGVTKHRYYDGKKVLDKEGDPVFDALSIAGVPINIRGQLEPGDVQIEGDSIIIKGENDAEDAVFDKNDHSAIVQHIRNLSAAKRNANRQLEAVRDKLDTIEQQHDKKFRELYAETDRIKATKVAEFAATPHMDARVELNIAFRRLTDVAARLSVVEKDQFRDSVLEDVAAWRADLAEAYKTNTPKKSAAVETPMDHVSDEDWFKNKLASIDIDAVPDDNDGELAAAL